MRTLPATFPPLEIQYALSCSLYTVAFVLFCLSLIRKRSRGGRAAPWLIALTIAFGLMMLNNGYYLAIRLIFRPGQFTLPLPPWYFPAMSVSRAVLLLSQACLAWGAFRLWTSSREARAARDSTILGKPPQEQEDTWPPAPSLRQ